MRSHLTRRREVTFNFREVTLTLRREVTLNFCDATLNSNYLSSEIARYKNTKHFSSLNNSVETYKLRSLLQIGDWHFQGATGRNSSRLSRSLSRCGNDGWNGVEWREEMVGGRDQVCMERSDVSVQHMWNVWWSTIGIPRFDEIEVCSIKCVIPLLAFPVDIGRKPASSARGSRQRLHAGESRLCRWRLHAG